MHKALIIIAHGSRRVESNREVEHLTANVTDLLADQYDHIMTAFLELAEPLIPEAIGACVERGATTVHLFPYFLAGGRHVTEDIPAAIATAAEKHSDTDLVLLPYFGSHDGITKAVASAITKAPSQT